MSRDAGKARYRLTRAELERHCYLLAKIEVVGSDSKHEKLIGRNHAGEIVVQTTKGKVTPAKLEQFLDAYNIAVARGIIKPRQIGSVDGPDDPKGYGDR